MTGANVTLNEVVEASEIHAASDALATPMDVPYVFPLVANQAKLEAHIGMPLHPEVFDVRPFGNRLVVVREAVKAFSATCQSCGKRNLTVAPSRLCAYCGAQGLVALEIPQQARDIPASGWVVSAGQEATLPQPPRSIPLDTATLLGCKVLFATYGGYTLHVGDVGETLYEGRYVLIESTAVYALVGGLPKELLL